MPLVNPAKVRVTQTAMPCCVTIVFFFFFFFFFSFFCFFLTSSSSHAKAFSSLPPFVCLTPRGLGHTLRLKRFGRLGHRYGLV